MAEGYGVDVSLTDKLVTGRLVSGKALVLEALYRRLITARGTLGSDMFPEDLAYGIDVSAFVGAVGYPRAQAVVAGMVENELSKEDRVVGVRCISAIDDLGAGQLRLRLDVTGTLAETEEDFSLTLGVSDILTTILGTS